MTNPDKTLIAALLDRSGSMIDSKEATEQGWRGLIAEQAKQPGDCQVTLAQFDTSTSTLYSNLPINQLPEFNLQPRWGTALLDATGKFITEIGARLAAIPEDDRPGKVICLIMTDGMENSAGSGPWRRQEAGHQQREQWNWEFIFMGANMDAVEVAASMGIARGLLDHLRRRQRRGQRRHLRRRLGADRQRPLRDGRRGQRLLREDRDKAMGKGKKKAKTST